MRSFEIKEWQASLRFHDLPGEMPPLLFIHGLGCASSADFPRVACDPRLARRRRWLVDLLGFGFSDRPSGFGYRVEDHARTIADFVDHMGAAEIAVFGHSMGGSIAIVAAAALGPKVTHLILGEPNLEPGGGEISRPIAAQRHEDFLASGFDELLRERRANGAASWAARIEVSDRTALLKGALSLVDGSRPTWLAMLEAMSSKRSVVMGEFTLNAGPLPALPEGVNVHVVNGAGHDLAFDNPSALAGIIAEELAR